MSEERRKSYRYRFEEGERWVMLRLQRREIPAQVLDESAGGFSLRLDGEFTIHVGDLVVVNSTDLWCEAKVAHVEPLESGLRLGLERLREQQIGAQPGRCGPTHLSHAYSRPRDFLTTVIVCIGVSLTVVTLSWYFRPQLRSLLGSNPDVVFINASGSRQATMDFLSAKQDPVLNAGLQRLTLLRKPDFLANLQLSPRQQADLEAILQETSRSLELIYEETLEESRRKWSNRTLSTISRAEADLTRVLSEEQLVRWRELAENKPAGGG